MIAKKGKTYAYRFGATLWILTALLIIFIPANANPLMVYALGALMGFGISGPGLVPHTMYGDVVDAGQLVFGERLDGQMSGFTNFINKIAQAIGLAGVMFLIGLAGFMERQPGEPFIPSQPDSATLMIRLIMVIAPFMLMSIGMFISTKYKIDASLQHEITRSLEQSDEIKDDLIKRIS
jgi:Na+/melibiose symporter-like transporter